MKTIADLREELADRRCELAAVGAGLEDARSVAAALGGDLDAAQAAHDAAIQSRAAAEAGYVASPTAAAEKGIGVADAKARAAGVLLSAQKARYGEAAQAVAVSEAAHTSLTAQVNGLETAIANHPMTTHLAAGEHARPLLNSVGAFLEALTSTWTVFCAAEPHHRFVPLLRELADAGRVLDEHGFHALRDHAPGGPLRTRYGRLNDSALVLLDVVGSALAAPPASAAALEAFKVEIEGLASHPTVGAWWAERDAARRGGLR